MHKVFIFIYVEAEFNDLRRRWAWHLDLEIKFSSVCYVANFVPNLVSLAFIITEICVFKQTEERQTHEILSINYSSDVG